MIYSACGQVQKNGDDVFVHFIRETVTQMPSANSGVYVVPTENDYREWTKIFLQFRNHSFDSCKQLLARYNYEIIQIKDVSYDNVYNIIREKYPIVRGWGTYIHNNNFKKRLHIHINHPLDDPNAIYLGTEIFRRLDAEWCLIAGTSRKAIAGKLTADVGRIRKSIFQHWHEMLSNLTYVALSIHSYDETKFSYPINLTEIIISNGRTTDDQWGISELSLAFRDTLRSLGYACSLAMYDSGYAPLAGGWNMQGTFSNDSLGFGHWIYIEFSKKVREKYWEYSKLISSIDRALDITGKKISQQVNRAFGLVSPRVIKIDQTRRLFFPSGNVDTYRIISFDEKRNKSDTIDVRLGNWLNLINSKKSITAVSVIDSSERENFNTLFKKSSSSSVVSKILDNPKRVSSIVKVRELEQRDSTFSDEDEENNVEPLQVHRIPLKPILQQTFETRQESYFPAFKWDGVVKGYFTPVYQSFDFSSETQNDEEISNLPNFLIPLINNSYRTGKNVYLGIQMTTYLMSEIVRLVNEYQVIEKDLGLLAEQTESGEYYLRIFPAINREYIDHTLSP